MLIPIFNLIYLIIVAVGSPTRNKSMTNYARARLIWWAIWVVISIVLSIALSAWIINIFSNTGWWNYSFDYSF
jgi:hypothetical protein